MTLCARWNKSIERLAYFPASFSGYIPSLLYLQHANSLWWPFLFFLSFFTHCPKESLGKILFSRNLTWTRILALVLGTYSQLDFVVEFVHGNLKQTCGSCLFHPIYIKSSMLCRALKPIQAYSTLIPNSINSDKNV